MSQSGHSTPRNYTAEGLKIAKSQYNARNESGAGANLVYRGRGVSMRAGADFQHRTKPAHAGDIWRSEPGADAGDRHGLFFAADLPRRRARAAVLGADVIRSTSLVRAADVVRAVRSLREYPHARSLAGRYFPFSARYTFHGSAGLAAACAFERAAAHSRRSGLCAALALVGLSIPLRRHAVSLCAY